MNIFYTSDHFPAPSRQLIGSGRGFRLVIITEAIATLHLINAEEVGGRGGAGERMEEEGGDEDRVGRRRQRGRGGDRGGGGRRREETGKRREVEIGEEG